jgi:3-oxoadipate enol-lactonase
MPQLNFTKEGKGPVVVLSHALGCDLGMWDGVAEGLKSRYTVLRYDHRGHGKSEAVPGPYTMETLADDAAALITDQVDGPVHFVGLSMGGMTAQSLAIRYPQLVRSIVVANSAGHYDDAAKALWKARIDTVLDKGMKAISDGAMQRWFTPEFRADEANGGAQRVAKLRAGLEANDPKAYAASCDAVCNINFGATNPLIACPALIIAGTRDEATPVALSETIANAISGAQLRTIDAAHLSAVEKPVEFAALVRDFFKTI